jgi:hypothetical protein
MHQSHCLPHQEKGIDFYSDTGLFVRLDRCVPISVSSLANFALVGPMALEQLQLIAFPYSAPPRLHCSPGVRGSLVRESVRERR